MRAENEVGFLGLSKDIIRLIFLSHMKSGEDLARLTAVCTPLKALIMANAFLRERIQQAKNSKGIQVQTTYETTFIWQNFKDHVVMAAAGRNYGHLGTGDKLTCPSFKRIELPADLIHIQKIIPSSYVTFLLGKDSLGKDLLAIAGREDLDLIQAFPEFLETTPYRFTPVRLPSEMVSITKIITKDGIHFADFAFILGKDSEGGPLLAALGDSQYGQLGNNLRGPILTLVDLPVEVACIIDVALNQDSFSAYALIHAKDLDNNSMLLASGNNSNGQLGTGDYVSLSKFTRVALPIEFTQITHIGASSGGGLVCGINSDNRPLLAFSGNARQFGSEEKLPFFTLMNLPENLLKIDQIFHDSLTTFLYGLDCEGKAILLEWYYEFPDNLCKVHPIPSEFSKAPIFYARFGGIFLSGQGQNGQALIAGIGGNSYGQMGIRDILPDRGGFFSIQKGADPRTVKNELTFIPLPKELCHVVDLSASMNHTIISGLKSNNFPMVLTCGYNSFGQLGIGKIRERLCKSDEKNTFNKILFPEGFRTKQSEEELLEEEASKKSGCSIC